MLLKSDGFPTYHLANVIDDHMMEITHIMRAQGGSLGPLHILLYEAFGWEPPMHHLPMVMGKDGQKLSKRHGSTAVAEFRKEEAIFPKRSERYVSSSDGRTTEPGVLLKEELEELFSLEKINKAPGVFDYKKLDWFNGQYIRMKSDEELLDLLMPYLAETGWPLTDRAKLLHLTVAKERLKVLSDITGLARFLFEEPAWDDLSIFAAKRRRASVGPYRP